MAEVTHTFDPDGEVIIVLECANEPLAPNLAPYQPPEPAQKRKRDTDKDEQARKRRKGLQVYEDDSSSDDSSSYISSSYISSSYISSSDYSSSDESSSDESSSDESSSEESPIGAPPAQASHLQEPSARAPVAEIIEVKSDTETPAAEEPAPKSYRLRASAKHLTLASAVFGRALKGGWKEGTSLQEKGTTELTATGWDLDAFLILMNIFHASPQRLPKKVSLELLAKVAMLADYYECQEAVRYWILKWFNALEKPCQEDHRGLILTILISWVFRLPVTFREVTSLVIRDFEHPVTSHGLPIPGSVLDKLNRHREKAIAAVLSFIDEQSNAFLRGSRSNCCFNCSAMMYGVFVKEMHVEGLHPHPQAPFQKVSYAEVLATVQDIAAREWCFEDLDADDFHKCPGASVSLDGIPQDKITQGLLLKELQ